MNSRRVKIFEVSDGSGVCRQRGTTWRLLATRAGAAGAALSSRLCAHNSPDWLEITGAGPGLWLDKPRQRLCTARERLRRVMGVRPADWSALSARLCAALQIDPATLQARGLPVLAEPAVLWALERDHFGRVVWLAPPVWPAWQGLRAAARADGLSLSVVSGWRSMHHQARLLAAKRARGIALADILRVNAAPGYSEHHAGTALDLTTPGGAVLEAAFEDTPAFGWLLRHAPRHGFHLTLPRDNPYGYVYEPWHWNWRADG